GGGGDGGGGGWAGGDAGGGERDRPHGAIRKASAGVDRPSLGRRDGRFGAAEERQHENSAAQSGQHTPGWEVHRGLPGNGRTRDSGARRRFERGAIECGDPNASKSIL